MQQKHEGFDLDKLSGLCYGKMAREGIKSAMCAPVNDCVLVHARQDSQQGCYYLQGINLVLSTPQVLPSDPLTTLPVHVVPDSSF